MACFSLFTQGCCGTSYSIVPYIDPAATGIVTGLVGAGGNIGSLIFAAVFKAYVNDIRMGFMRETSAEQNTHLERRRVRDHYVKKEKLQQNVTLEEEKTRKDSDSIENKRPIDKKPFFALAFGPNLVNLFVSWA
ncbi:4365_t:CDS:2 [Scutellospora calospora]|uniref:4365_t:CDS:1 n=1 Tax=Scutellospora calospora TaxID=85575 RepID=A0ACA9JU75_9GLOM|nr:4365_t:CDS:2 [Scutellospora calospora]